MQKLEDDGQVVHFQLIRPSREQKGNRDRSILGCPRRLKKKGGEIGLGKSGA